MFSGHSGRCSQSEGSATAWILLLVVLLTTIAALPRVAQASSYGYLLYRQWQPYDWPENGPSVTEVTRSQRGLGWRREGSAGAFGVDYDYQPLRIRTGEPAHNGHLHRLTVGGHWLYRLYRVEMRAGLAGTSNMFKHQAFHNDVVNGRIAVFRAVNASSPLSLGVGGDHRFGSFRWIPRMRWEHVDDNGRWLVDLPVMLRWESPGELWQLLLQRRGDRWATLDPDRKVESALYLREWRAELRYRIRTARQWWPSVVVGIGASVETRVRYRDLEAGTPDVRLGDALFGTIKLTW